MLVPSRTVDRRSEARVETQEPSFRRRPSLGACATPSVRITSAFAVRSAVVASSSASARTDPRSTLVSFVLFALVPPARNGDEVWDGECGGDGGVEGSVAEREVFGAVLSSTKGCWGKGEMNAGYLLCGRKKSISEDPSAKRARNAPSKPRPPSPSTARASGTRFLLSHRLPCALDPVLSRFPTFPTPKFRLKLLLLSFFSPVPAVPELEPGIPIELRGRGLGDSSMETRCGEEEVVKGEERRGVWTSLLSATDAAPLSSERMVEEVWCGRGRVGEGRLGWDEFGILGGEGRAVERVGTEAFWGCWDCRVWTRRRAAERSTVWRSCWRDWGADGPLALEVDVGWLPLPMELEEG